MFSSLKLSVALICSELTLGMKEMPMSLTWYTLKASSPTASSNTSSRTCSAPRSRTV